jgi:FKBP-type peptidyl-prolyl cis-trans isomerase SlyD
MLAFRLISGVRSIHMQIAADSVVTFDYRLTDSGGELIDSSEDGPMTYLHGHGQIVRGLERALTGKNAGETLKVVVDPSEGYGEPSGGRPIVVSKNDLPPGLEPEEGMGFTAVAAGGQEVTLWVVGVQADKVHLSLDHPLAGVTLHFDVEIRDVRAATSEELAHGHVHGAGGHHHH